MKIKLLFFIGAMLCATYSFSQAKNLQAAESLAKSENKLILLKFSGSD